MTSAVDHIYALHKTLPPIASAMTISSYESAKSGGLNEFVEVEDNTLRRLPVMRVQCDEN